MDIFRVHGKSNVDSRLHVCSKSSCKAPGLPGRDFAPIRWNPKYLDSPVGADQDESDVEPPRSTERLQQAESGLVPRDTEVGTESRDQQQRCVSHTDSSAWVREPCEDRPGWECARCGRCGIFLGFNPVKQPTVELPSSDVSQMAPTRQRLIQGTATSS